MADKSIGELKKATALYDTSLLPMEQDGEAQALSGALLRKFAEDAGDAAGRAAVTNEVQQAANHAAAAAQAQQGAKTSETNAASSENAAAGSATKAAQSEKNAADSAATAQQYSGNPPKPINSTWWIWDAGIGSYKDTGVSSILRIVKSYTSIEAMEADYGNMQDNDLVIIATDVELEENSKLYIHTPVGWQYLSDLSGIQGPPGPQGIQGNPFTYADFTPEQLQELKGDPFTYSDFTPEQLENLRGPQGEQGEAFEYSDFTPEQLENLRGPRGYSGVHTGSDTPPEGTNVWIIPDGDPSGTEEWTFTLEDGSIVKKTIVVVN